MNRRTFLQSTAGLSALTMLGLEARPNAKSVGLQLYTLRSDIQKQGIEKILAEVAKLGYKKVENFGYNQGKFFGKTPTEYSKILADNGLKAISGHYMTARSKAFGDTDGLTKNWDKIVEDAAAIGQEYAVIAYLIDNERKPEDYKQLFDLLNKGSEVAKKAGLTLGYHNHDFEFTQKIDGEKPYDLLLKNTNVIMEVDLYWVAKAGENANEYFKKFPGRFPLWHVKDMANTEKKEFAEVGVGTIDFGALFKDAKKAGLKHYFVEQDVCQRPPLESIKISIDNIQAAKWG
ncbi:TIM barrel protein [Runella sp. SP2]|uniref:TIM barrel protein n=1 Tax=Runella sp. SP2 TaxID=2268026 RepID=UPI000F095FC4|nr:TIM barrel protein [Runella sp. SP2]AYQ35936.1 sugar phosphate isomerase/epimerase [Runella sp. SP2]